MSKNQTALTVAQAGGASGYARRMASESHRARVLAVGRLFQEATHGDKYAQLEFHDLMHGALSRPAREAMSTSDFPILFGDFLNRSLARRYAVAQPVWRRFAARQVVRDFRPAKIIDFMGAGGVLDRVPEYGEYPARPFNESEFTTTLAKYGDRLQWSWEMQVNDDLGAFDTAPQALSRGATVTEDYTATSVLCDAAGPNAALFAAVDNKPLTRENLEAAMQQITDVVDEDGNPIDIGTPVLVVPRALQLTAQNIVNTTETRGQVASGTTRQDIVSGNGLSETPEIVVNRWLTAINKSANAKTSWYLVPDPNGIRPAVYETFLRGYEAPDLRVKADAGMHLGGGQVDPAEGSFERDDVQYRVRHVVGGNVGFTDAVYASTGA